MRATIIIILLFPGIAWACALPPSVIMTLPTGYYLAGAAAVVALTGLFAGIAHIMPEMGERQLWERRIFVPTLVSSYISWIALLALLLIGFVGARDPMHNLLTLVIWTVVWVALPMASMVFGNLWRTINPWVAPVRLVRILLGFHGNVGISRLGHLPAVAGLLGFFWFYIVSLRPDDPFILACVVMIYWLIIFVIAVLEGEDWLQKGEFLTVYLGYLAKTAPFWMDVSGDRASVRMGWPGTQVLTMHPLSTSEFAFVTLALAGLSFDGLSSTFWWLDLIGQNPLEFTGRSAVVWPNTFGLIGTWTVTAFTIYGALWIGAICLKRRQVASINGAVFGRGVSFSTQQMMPTILSFFAIAAGYHSAHYLVTLLSTGQYTIAALNDPFFRGDSFLGLSTFYVSMGFLADRGVMIAIWNTQFLLILGAHVLAVILSFRLVGADFPAIAHAPLTILMVGYTVFGLWLLSSPSGF